MKTLYWTQYTSPISEFFLACSKEKSVSILKYIQPNSSTDYIKKYSNNYHFIQEKLESSLFQPLIHELDRYFHKELTTFTVETEIEGTDFQQRVWSALKAIPYGKRQSYSEIAKAIDNPKAVRAVGMANHSNPVAIIIPCHRVIGKNGSLTGYAGGLQIKEWLLDHESYLHQE